MNYRREKDYYFYLYPEDKKYINECLICHTVGYKPDMPEHIGGQFCKTAEKIRQMFKPALKINEVGLCEQCAKYY